MKKWLVFILGSLIVNFSFAQDVAVAKLRNETSRNIKKEVDTSTWNWKRGGLYNFNSPITFLKAIIPAFILML